MDITRKGRTPGFVKSTRNGVESFRYCLHKKKKIIFALNVDTCRHSGPSNSTLLDF